jgi:hypothetical protein
MRLGDWVRPDSGPTGLKKELRKAGYVIKVTNAKVRPHACMLA